MIYEDVKKKGKSAKGKQALVDYLSGKQLTMRQSMYAKCYECMNGYADGKVDCEITDCPIYPFMPYRKGEKLVMRKMSEGQKKKAALHLPKKTKANAPIEHNNARL